MSEAILGSDVYQCYYIQNDNATDDLNNVVLFIDSNTISEDDEIKLALGTSAKNGIEQTIADIFTEPSGITEWKLAETYNQGLYVAKVLKSGEKQAVWMWRHLDTTEEEAKNKAEFLIAFDPPPGSSGESGSGDGNGEGPSPDPGPATGDYEFAVTGDWSLSSDAQDTVDNIKSFSTIKLTVDTGDNSYEDSGDKWASITADLRKDGREMKMAFGNHDAKEGTPQPELTNFYLDLMGIQSDSKRYYDFTYNNFYFVFGDCYSDYSVGSDQYKFIKDKMEKAKTNSAIRWRALLFHEPVYTSPSHYTGVAKLRDAYHPLMIANDFDFWFNGHNHNYMRTYPLGYNSGSPSSPTLVNSGQEPNYNDPGAPIFIQVGTAGRSSHRTFDSQSSFAAKQQDANYGFLRIKVSNSGRQVTGQFFKNNGQEYEKFTVIK